MACSRQFRNGLDCGLGLLGLEDMVAAERNIYASVSGYRSRIVAPFAFLIYFVRVDMWVTCVMLLNRVRTYYQGSDIWAGRF